MAEALTGTWASLTTSSFGECINGVVTAIQGASLAEITTNVAIRKRPWDKQLAAPYCIVSPANDTHPVGEGLVNKKTVHYRIMVALVRASNQGLTEGLAIELLWRQQVTDLFDKLIPFSITGGQVITSSVTAGEPFIPEAFLKNLDAQYLLVDVEVRRT